MKATCPCCHRALPTPKAVKTVTVDTAAMTDAQLFAHYRKTGPAEDVAFFARHALLTPALRRELEALQADVAAFPMGRADVLRRLTAIHDAWRRLPEAVEVAVETDEQVYELQEAAL